MEILNDVMMWIGILYLVFLLSLFMRFFIVVFQDITNELKNKKMLDK